MPPSRSLPGTPVSALTVGDKSLLAPGAILSLALTRQPDGSQVSVPALSWKCRNRRLRLCASSSFGDFPCPVFPALALLCGVLCTSCATLRQDAPSGAKLGKWGVDLTSMDKDVKPGDNFFLHVNGGWLKTAQIPADRASAGSFQDLQILSEQRLRTIVEDLSKKSQSRMSVEERKLRDLYDSFVDTDAIEAKGLEPVRKDLDYLAGLATHEQVASAMGSIRLSTQSIYGIGMGIDDKNPDNYSVNLSQSGLGMPERDFYLSTQPDMVKTREAYRKYLADMMVLAGHGAMPPRAPTACWRWKPRLRAYPGPAPNAAMSTRPTIPCRRPI
jgi:hypothetical protein